MILTAILSLLSLCAWIAILALEDFTFVAAYPLPSATIAGAVSSLSVPAPIHCMVSA